MAQMGSCRADFAVVTNHLRYRADPVHYRGALRRYDRLLAGGRLRLVVRPVPGASSGPEVHIVELVRPPVLPGARHARSEEHTSELQSLMRISYAVFCLKKKKIRTQ